MKKRVVIYARYSSDKQTEQSIEGQLRECYDFANKQGYIVVGEYVDRAMSGTADNRPKFLKMIEESRRKTFDYVLVYQLDRFSRSKYDNANYKHKLKKNGVRVISAREPITDDASGVLIEGVLESMAEYYSVELAQKVRRGRKESLIKGQFLGGPLLFGYRKKNPDKEHPDFKKLVIDENEGPIMKRIFEDYANGTKATEIANQLNAEGLKNKFGKPFTANMLAIMLRNEKYTGKVTENGVTYINVFPRLISDNLFNRCQDTLDTHKHRQKDITEENKYILSGKMFCGKCSATMAGESGTGRNGIHRYYKCHSRKKKLNDCTKENIKQSVIENLIFEKTREFILKPHIIESISVMVSEKFNSEIAETAIIEILEKELRNTDKSINAIIDALLKGITSKTTQTLLEQFEKEKEDLQAKIAIEKARQIKPLEAQTVKDFLILLASREYESKLDRNTFFDTFIKKVILFDDSVLIIYNTSLDKENEIYLPKDLTGIFNQLEERQLMTGTYDMSINANEPPFSKRFERLGSGGK